MTDPPGNAPKNSPDHFEPEVGPSIQDLLATRLSYVIYNMQVCITTSALVGILRCGVGQNNATVNVR